MKPYSCFTVYVKCVCVFVYPTDSNTLKHKVRLYMCIVSDSCSFLVSVSCLVTKALLLQRLYTYIFYRVVCKSDNEISSSILYTENTCIINLLNFYPACLSFIALGVAYAGVGVPRLYFLQVLVRPRPA